MTATSDTSVAPRPESANRSLGRDAVMTFAVTAAVAALNLASGIVLARVLGPHGRGELAAIVVLPTVLAWLFGLGAEPAISFHQARHPRDAPHLLSAWLLFAVPSGLLALLVGELLVPVVLGHQGNFTVDLARIFLPTLFFLILSEPFTGVLLGDHDFGFINLRRFAAPLFVVIGYVVLWALGGLEVESALLVIGLVQLADLLAVGIRATWRRSLGRPQLRLARQTLWYAVRAHGDGVAAVLNARLDFVMLPAFVSAASIGYYAVASSASWVIVAFAGGLATFVLPVAARRAEGGSGAVMSALHITLALGAAFAVGLGLGADVIVEQLFGQRFASAVLPLRLLLPGVVLYAGAAILGAGLYSLDQPFTATAAEGGAAIITIVGLAIFLPSGGIVAAAVVSSVAYGTAFVLRLVTYRRAAGLDWSAFLPTRTSWQWR